LSSLTSLWHFTALTQCPDLSDHIIMHQERWLYIEKRSITVFKPRSGIDEEQAIPAW